MFHTWSISVLLTAPFVLQHPCGHYQLIFKKNVVKLQVCPAVATFKKPETLINEGILFIKSYMKSLQYFPNIAWVVHKFPRFFLKNPQTTRDVDVFFRKVTSRDVRTSGCVHFTWWSDGGCHLQEPWRCGDLDLNLTVSRDNWVILYGVPRSRTCT